MPRGGGYDVTGLAVKVTREGISETSRDLKTLAKAADGAETQVDQLGKESKETGRALKDLDRSSASAGASFKGMIGAMAGLAAAYLAFKKLAGAMGAAVDAAAEQQKTFAGLDIALANAGISYDQLSGSLDKYFAMLQKTTVYGDTDSAEALRFLTVVTGDYGSAMKLIEPTLQFSAAMHIDIATAARLAGQAATGMTGTLSRYGIILSQTVKDQLALASSSEKATIVADMLNEKFAGSAQAELKTYSGSLRQLGNYWGDFTEAVGDWVVTSSVAPAIFSEMTDTSLWLTDAANTVGDAFEYMQETGDFSAVAASIESLKQALDGLGAGVNTDNLKLTWIFFANVIASEVSSKIENFARVVNMLDGAIEGIAAHGPNMKAVTEGLAEGWSRSLEVMPELVASHETLEEKLARINAEISVSLAATKKYADSMGKAGAATAKVVEYVDPFITALKETQAGLEAQDQSLDRYNEMLKDTAEETQAVTDSTKEMVKEFDLTVFPEPPDDAVQAWTETFGDIEGSFSNMLGKGFTGELESFADLWEEIWADLAKSMTGMLTDAFSDWLQGGKLDEEGEVIPGTGGFMQSMEGMTAGQRVGMGIGGAGMVYQGAQQGGTAGVLTGAMGGAMAGVSFGPWGAVIGAVVGGLAAYFGQSDEAVPTTNVRAVGGGSGRFGITTTDQGLTAHGDRAVSQALGSVYRGLANSWRDMLRGMGDSELFDLLREMPAVVHESFDMSAQALTQWLSEDKLPRLFQQQYGRAIRTGLRNLGMTSDAMEGLFDEIRRMPGTERLAALNSVIAALRISSEMIAMDWGAINVEAGKTPVEQWTDDMVDAGSAMELLTAGWEDMSLVDRAADLEQIGGIFETVTQSTIGMLQQLEQIARSLDAMFAATVEGFTTRGMDEDALWAYYNERYNYYNNLLQTTDDPNLILEYTQQMLGILNNASGMLTDEQWQAMAGGTGMTWQEWFLSVTGGAQEAADAAVQEQQDAIQAQYDILWNQMTATTDRFNILTEAVEPVVVALDPIPDLLDQFSDALIRAREAASGANNLGAIS